MPDNYKTNVVVDLEGLNEVYKVSKERVDRIVVGGTTVGGTTAVKYAEKIGSSTNEGTVNEGTVTPSNIGHNYDPVYINNGTITPIQGNGNTISLGKPETTVVELGNGTNDGTNGTSPNVTEVKSGKFTSRGDIESLSGNIEVGLNDNNGGYITARETIKGKKLEANASDGVFIGGTFSNTLKGVTLNYDNTLNALTFNFT